MNHGTDTPLWRWRVALTLLSASLFLLSLTQPAFHWGAAGASAPTARVLLQGWKGLTAGYVEWLANPTLLITWTLALRGHPSLSRGSAATAVLLMLVFLLRQSLTMPGVASGAAPIITSYGTGYWLWVLSGVASLIGSFL